MFVTEVPATLLSALLVHTCGVLHVSLLFPLPLVSLVLDTALTAVILSSRSDTFDSCGRSTHDNEGSFCVIKSSPKESEIISTSADLIVFVSFSV